MPLPANTTLLTQYGKWEVSEDELSYTVIWQVVLAVQTDVNGRLGMVWYGIVEFNVPLNTV